MTTGFFFHIKEQFLAKILSLDRDFSLLITLATIVFSMHKIITGPFKHIIGFF